jgi:hypothetical protein
MVVKTWIEMLREKLKHISSLLSLGAYVNAFLRVWPSSVHPLVGWVIIRISRRTY